MGRNGENPLICWQVKNIIQLQRLSYRQILEGNEARPVRHSYGSFNLSIKHRRILVVMRYSFEEKSPFIPHLLVTQIVQ